MSKVIPTIPLPKYYQIKEVVSAEIAKKKANDKLPTVRQMRDRFHVSQMTIDKALFELEKEGLIRREQGRGIFVARVRRIKDEITAACHFDEPIVKQLQRTAAKTLQAKSPSAQIHFVPFEDEAVWKADVVCLYTSQIHFAAPHMMSLDELVSESELERFDKRALRIFQREGRLFVLPRMFSPVVLYYNKNCFDEVGIDYPNPEWTWEELQYATQKLTNTRKGIYGFLALAHFGARLPFIWQNGGEIFDSNGKECLIDSTPVIDALEFWQKLERISPVERETQNLKTLYEMFLSGRIAMFPWGGYLRGRACAEENFRWGVAPLPKGKKRATLLLAEGYGVTNIAQNRALALEFAKELVSRESQEIQAAAGYPIVTDKSLQKEFPIESVFYTELEHSRIVWEHQYNEEWRIISSEFLHAWQNDLPIGQTCHRVKEIVAKIMKSRSVMARSTQLRILMM